MVKTSGIQTRLFEIHKTPSGEDWTSGSKTDKEIFDFSANWYSRNMEASSHLHPNDWKVAPYKDAYVATPSEPGRTSYMHIIGDGDCIGFSLTLLSLESAYQKLLDHRKPFTGGT